jgi:transposase
MRPRLAIDAVDQVRRRVQNENETLGHRGRKGDPLFGIRRVMRRGAVRPTVKQDERLLTGLASALATRPVNSP